MYHAPNVQLSGTSYCLSDGKAGIFQTIRIMRRMVRDYKIDPAIRQAAVNVAFLTPEKMQRAEAQSVFEFVRDNIRYVRDIAGVETLMTPDKTLATRIGDCDDQTVLLASMLESIGYLTRFVVTGYSDPKVLEHVYLQVLIDGAWVNADPTEREPFGYAPPDPVIMYAEKV